MIKLPFRTTAFVTALAVAQGVGAQGLPEIPDWYLNPPKDTRAVRHVLGHGTSKFDAIADALYKIHGGGPLETPKDSIVVVSRGTVAGLEVSGRTVKVRSVVGGVESIRFSQAIRVSTRDGDKIQRFTSTVRPQGQDEEDQFNLGVAGDLAAIMSALERSGVTLRTMDTRTVYYVLVTVPVSAIGGELPK